MARNFEARDDKSFSADEKAQHKELRALRRLTQQTREKLELRHHKIVQQASEYYQFWVKETEGSAQSAELHSLFEKAWSAAEVFVDGVADKKNYTEEEIGEDD